MKKELAMAALAAVLPMAAFAEEEAAENFTTCVYADFNSAYVSKGVVGNDEFVFQPGIDVNAPYGFGFQLWGNMNMTDAKSAAWDPDTKGKWSEWDIGMSWTAPTVADLFSLTVGAVYFVYPQAKTDDPTEAAADDDYELYAKLSADCLLQPSVKFGHDLNNSDDWFIEAAISHSFDTCIDNLSLDLGADIYYVGDYFAKNSYGSAGDAGFAAADASIGLSYALADGLSIGVKGCYTTLIDSDIRDAAEANTGDKDNKDIFWGGANFSYEF